MNTLQIFTTKLNNVSVTSYAPRWSLKLVGAVMVSPNQLYAHREMHDHLMQPGVVFVDVHTMTKHFSFFAKVSLHEPYWNNDKNCGYIL